MSYLDRIKACNHYDPDHFRPFYVDGVRVGSTKHAFAEFLRDWPEVFHVSSETVRLSPALTSFQARSDAVDRVFQTLLEQGIIPRRHGEKYPVTPWSRDTALFQIDRAAAPYFGIRAFGQHMNGFVRDGGRLKMWLARRARSRWNAPGKLDNLVAGGLPHGLSLWENLRKECWEEAAIPAELAAMAKPVGLVSYRAETSYGLKPDTMYCYDLELPVDFQPRCTDGEVETFYLWPVEQVAERVRDTEELKLNCNLVIIDFLIRWGILGPEHDEYLDLAKGLRA